KIADRARETPEPDCAEAGQKPGRDLRAKGDKNDRGFLGLPELLRAIGPLSRLRRRQRAPGRYGDIRGRDRRERRFHIGHVPYPLTSAPASSVQPSASTKNASLNGNETTAGGTIIIPIAIRIEATTRSMMRNGMKMRNPISNARLT